MSDSDALNRDFENGREVFKVGRLRSENALLNSALNHALEAIRKIEIISSDGAACVIAQDARLDIEDMFKPKPRGEK